MSERHSTAKLTTIFAMPPEGGVEVPMICPCCETTLGVRAVFDGTPDAHGTMPLSSTLMQCRSCEFSAHIWIGEDKVSITWGGGER